MDMTELGRVARLRQLMASGEARRIRESIPVSLTEAAAAASVYASTILRWETGERVPHGPAAVRYLLVLDGLARIVEKVPA